MIRIILAEKEGGGTPLLLYYYLSKNSSSCTSSQREPLGSVFTKFSQTVLNLVVTKLVRRGGSDG